MAAHGICGSSKLKSMGVDKSEPHSYSQIHKHIAYTHTGVDKVNSSYGEKNTRLPGWPLDVPNALNDPLNIVPSETFTYFFKQPCLALGVSIFLFI